MTAPQHICSDLKDSSLSAAVTVFNINNTNYCESVCITQGSWSLAHWPRHFPLKVVRSSRWWLKLSSEHIKVSHVRNGSFLLYICGWLWTSGNRGSPCWQSSKRGPACWQTSPNLSMYRRVLAIKQTSNLISAVFWNVSITSTYAIKQ